MGLSDKNNSDEDAKSKERCIIMVTIEFVFFNSELFCKKFLTASPILSGF